MSNITKKSLWLWILPSLLLAGLVVLFFLSGWRLFVIKTPSMGQTAPAGSLIVAHARPDYKKGDIVAFVQNDRVYIHRIVGIDSKKDNAFITKGDLNGAADPWRVNSNNIIGRAASITRHAGWLLLALPWLTLGFIIVYLLSILPKLAPQWRWPVRIMGGAIVITLVSLWLHPWINFGFLGYVPNQQAGVDMHIVNTGIFNIKAEGTVLSPGEDAIINIPYSDSAGRFVLLPRPALGFWGVVWMIIFALLPLFASLALLPRQKELDKETKKKVKDQPLFIDRYYALIITLIIVIVVTLLSLQLSALAAFVASINNTSNNIKTRQFFLCHEVAASGQPKPYLSYAMGTTGITAQDISGNGRNGTFSSAAPVQNGDIGCLRDTPRSSAFENRCLAQDSWITGPSVFSIAVWFKTQYKNTDNSGKLVGFGNNISVSDSNYDRHIYIDKDGRVVFGVYPGTVRLVSSPAGKNYADNTWHHVVLTMGPNGTFLYLDGEQAGSDPTLTQAQSYSGYWKFGCGRLVGWRNADGSTASTPNYFRGSLQYGSIYHTALTPENVKDQYLAGAQ